MPVRSFLIASVGIAFLSIAHAANLSKEHRAEGEQLLQWSAAEMIKTLKDSESSKFRDVYIRTTIGKNGNTYVGICGFINAKNSYGGYTGWQAWSASVLGNQGFKLFIGDDGLIEASVLCRTSVGYWDAKDYSDRMKKWVDTAN
ncbi:MAG: hypothetical protein QM698_07835 [Micropepsaceae bacterium]